MRSEAAISNWARGATTRTTRILKIIKKKEDAAHEREREQTTQMRCASTLVLMK